MGYDNAVLVAAFYNEDPRTSQNQINNTRQKYPKTLAKGINSCYRVCNINTKS